MRFQWLADEPAATLRRRNFKYERYRPWRRYDAVVFLKSMGTACTELNRQLVRQGVKTVFDCNVDYVTPAQGRFYYDGMAPTPTQREQALEMMRGVHGVIGDSQHIASVCAAHHSLVEWIPDNVRMDMVPSIRHTSGMCSGRLRLLWSGTTVKAAELLVIEDVLRSYKRHISLMLVTNGLGDLARIYEPFRSRLRALLNDLEATIIPFTGIRELLARYADGGVFISPRFLDNSYNLGHSEWKITLPLACGRRVLCSDQPSYRTVAARAPGAVTLCRCDNEWVQALDRMLSGVEDWTVQAEISRSVVEKYYATPVIAEQWADFVSRLVS